MHLSGPLRTLKFHILLCYLFYDAFIDSGVDKTFSETTENPQPKCEGYWGGGLVDDIALCFDNIIEI